MEPLGNNNYVKGVPQTTTQIFIILQDLLWALERREHPGLNKSRDKTSVRRPHYYTRARAHTHSSFIVREIIDTGLFNNTLLHPLRMRCSTGKTLTLTTGLISFYLRTFRLPLKAVKICNKDNLYVVSTNSGKFWVKETKFMAFKVAPMQ